MRRRTRNWHTSNESSLKTNEHGITANTEEKFETTAATTITTEEESNIKELEYPLRKSPIKTRSRTGNLTECNLIQTGRLGKTLRERAKPPLMKNTLLKNKNISSKTEVKTKMQASNNSESGVNITRHSLRIRNVNEKEKKENVNQKGKVNEKRKVNENASRLPKKFIKAEKENVFRSLNRGSEVDSMFDTRVTRSSLRKGKRSRSSTNSHKNSKPLKIVKKDSTNNLEEETFSSRLAGKDVKKEESQNTKEDLISVEHGSVAENDVKKEESQNTKEVLISVEHGSVAENDVKKEESQNTKEVLISVEHGSVAENDVKKEESQNTKEVLISVEHGSVAENDVKKEESQNTKEVLISVEHGSVAENDFKKEESQNTKEVLISVEHGPVAENEYLESEKQEEYSITASQDTMNEIVILPFSEVSTAEPIFVYTEGRDECTIQSKSPKSTTENYSIILTHQENEYLNFHRFTDDPDSPSKDLGALSQRSICSSSEEINENIDENVTENNPIIERGNRKCFSIYTFNYEYMRLKTFKNRIYSIGDCRLFAECGFICIYYSDTNTNDDIMYCVYCGIAVTNFIEISPDNAHKLANPNCPFYLHLSFNVPLCPGRERLRDGNPLEKLNKFLEDYLIYRTACTSIDSTIASEFVDDLKKLLGDDYLRSHSLLLENDYCTYLETIQRKLAETLLFNNGLELKDMANGGFLITEFSDLAVCFKCNGGLLNWESTDDPKKEHARFFPECKFVTDSYSQTVINKISNSIECLKRSIPKREIELTTEETDLLLEHPLSKVLTEGAGLNKNFLKEALKNHLEKYAIFPSSLFHINHVIVDYVRLTRVFPTRYNLK
ncbi:UNVERIFIED_CONTAM: hypothetical protein RMT77_001250 [Armadillidium vulgare]